MGRITGKGLLFETDIRLAGYVEWRGDGLKRCSIFLPESDSD